MGPQFVQGKPVVRLRDSRPGWTPNTSAAAITTSVRGMILCRRINMSALWHTLRPGGNNSDADFHPQRPARRATIQVSSVCPASPVKAKEE